MTTVPEGGDGSEGAATAVSPSNRGETREVLCVAGLDTVSFLVDIDAAREDGTAESPVFVDTKRAGGPGDEHRYRRVMPSGASLMHGVGSVAKVEASLPKRLGEWQPLGIDEAWGVMHELWLEASEYVTLKPGQTLDSARLSRVDCTRDVSGVLDIGQALDAFASRPLDQRWKKRRYADAEANSAQTYRVGPKAWSHVAYDKEAETAGRAPGGTLRLETRVTRDLMGSQEVIDAGAAMHRVQDLEAHRVDALSRLVIRRTGMDQKVAAMDQLAKSVMAHPLLSARERQACLGYAVQVSLGMRPEGDPKTVRKYRRVLEDLGVTPGPGCMEGLTGAYSMWLDLDRGEAVYEAA